MAAGRDRRGLIGITEIEAQLRRRIAVRWTPTSRLFALLDSVPCPVACRQSARRITVASGQPIGASARPDRWGLKIHHRHRRHADRDTARRIDAGRRPGRDATIPPGACERRAPSVDGQDRDHRAGPTSRPGKTRKSARSRCGRPGRIVERIGSAVAAHMVPGAIGSQTNGSVMRRAAFCGRRDQIASRRTASFHATGALEYCTHTGMRSAFCAASRMRHCWRK